METARCSPSWTRCWSRRRERAAAPMTTNRSRFALGACALIAAWLGAGPSPVWARRGVRPFFEPTDLELEKTGMVDIDVQVGAVQSRGPARVVVPDFELDFG